jgi:hypothetical protein
MNWGIGRVDSIERAMKPSLVVSETKTGRKPERKTEGRQSSYSRINVPHEPSENELEHTEDKDQSSEELEVRSESFPLPEIQRTAPWSGFGIILIPHSAQAALLSWVRTFG